MVSTKKVCSSAQGMLFLHVFSRNHSSTLLRISAENKNLWKIETLWKRNIAARAICSDITILTVRHVFVHLMPILMTCK